MEKVEMEWYSVMRDFPLLWLLLVSLIIFLKFVSSSSFWSLFFISAFEPHHMYPFCALLGVRILGQQVFYRSSFVATVLVLCQPVLFEMVFIPQTIHFPLIMIFRPICKYILIKFVQDSFHEGPLGDCSYPDKWDVWK